ncbi:Hypothetical predicted protein [Xyrichtys novacula]|uniref:Uncharacterized protein n=1 Tax=Xyrichtys novacula TaxID=13765 RepID=A0AAV1H7D0_XYRNO|nr:Hypothetical predicted protein [Xyrichtys novacula]
MITRICKLWIAGVEPGVGPPKIKRPDSRNSPAEADSTAQWLHFLGRLSLQLWSHHSRLPSQLDSFSCMYQNHSTLQHKLCSLHLILLCLQLDLSCLHPILLCLQPDLSCLHPIHLCLQPDLFCLHPDLLCLQPELSCLHPDLFCLQPTLLCQLHNLWFLLDLQEPCLTLPSSSIKGNNKRKSKLAKQKGLTQVRPAPSPVNSARGEPATHQQYFGNWHCQATATMTLAEWRATLEA